MMMESKPIKREVVSEDPSGVKEFLSWKIRVSNFKGMKDSNLEGS